MHPFFAGPPTKIAIYRGKNRYKPYKPCGPSDWKQVKYLGVGEVLPKVRQK